MTISTGVVADSSVNCDNECEFGLSAANAMEGKSFADIKLSRNDRVTTKAGTKNTVIVWGQEAVVNPTFLFMRITCVMNDSTEMEDYLTFELA